MAATWTVTNLDSATSLNQKSDVVTTVHWLVTDSETVGSGDNAVTHIGRDFGVVQLDTSDLSSFKTYADIAESDAVAWAKSALGSEKVTAAEEKVASQIAESKTPSIITGVPW